MVNVGEVCWELGAGSGADFRDDRTRLGRTLLFLFFIYFNFFGHVDCFCASVRQISRFSKFLCTLESGKWIHPYKVFSTEVRMMSDERRRESKELHNSETESEVEDQVSRTDSTGCD